MSKQQPFFLDRFSAGLDDMPRKQQADSRAVAVVLARLGRFSIFEATENQTIAKTMERIKASGWFVFDTTCSYPWTTVTLTDAGREVIGKAEAA